MSQSVPDAPVQPLKLPDGSTLNQQQTHALFLAVTTPLNLDEIAERSGYASGHTVGGFLRSDKGLVGRYEMAKRHLAEAATQGLRRMMQLAQQDVNKTVAQLAAKDLMDRAGLRISAQQGDQAPSDAREVKITINLPGTAGEDAIDVTPDE